MMMMTMMMMMMMMMLMMMMMMMMMTVCLILCFFHSVPLGQNAFLFLSRHVPGSKLLILIGGGHPTFNRGSLYISYICNGYSI